MKLKEKMKRFWTLSRHHAEGFTLVELIVVIAILAILAGVAVPVYSTYIKQANMQADQSLVAEIENALLLGYYSETGTPASGYIILSTAAPEFSDGADGKLAGYLKATFGNNLNALTLKYDGWSSALTSDNVQHIAGSSFAKEKLDSLLGSVNGLTGVLETFLGGESFPALKKFAEDNGITDAGSQTVANMAPMYVAGELTSSLLGNYDEGTTKQDKFVQYYKDTLSAPLASTLCDQFGMDHFTAYAVEYAQVEGMLNYYVSVSTGEAKTAAEAMLAKWKADTADLKKIAQAEGVQAVQNLLSSTKTALAQSTGATSQEEFEKSWLGQYRTTKAATDAMAFCGYMEGLTETTSTLLKNPEKLNDANYYKSSGLSSLISNYLSASEKLQSMDIDNAVLILLDENGETSVLMNDSE